MAIYDDIIERFIQDSSVNVPVSSAGDVYTSARTYTIPHPAILNESAYRQLANDTSIMKSMSEVNAARIDGLEKILNDILGLLAVMYDREGPRVDNMSDVRAFIDSIKVVEEGGHD